MKYAIIFFIATVGLFSCTSTKKAPLGENSQRYNENESVRIANDSLEYEITITDIGFPRFLNTQPPQDYYSLNFLERRNQIFVAEYNRRVLDNRFSRDLYPQRIDYNVNTRYGQEVNYLLYMYFRYFAREYNQNFPGIRN